MPIRTFAMMDLVMTPVAFRCVVASGGQLTKSRSCRIRYIEVLIAFECSNAKCAVVGICAVVWRGAKKKVRCLIWCGQV
jgi:hypothetical protein